MEFKKKPMVNWYDPKQLASTAIKTVISGIFGNFADRREMEAALSPGTTFCDFSTKEELWIDYVSDLGDGFNSTYTVAHLLAREKLTTKGHTLNRGDILVMGGDAVYPTPEVDEYRNRLQGPYNAASPWTTKEEAKRLFVLPGNHDWYDGLTNFLRLFCQNRSLGSWLTEQKRSYFAVKLPHHYWLLGIDVQLNSDIDKPQIDYFMRIAESESFDEKTKIILCTAEPSWVYKSWNEENKSHERIQFFIDKVLRGEDCDYAEKNKDLHIAAILTGDLHHYSRYEQTHVKTDRSLEKVQLITAGGGGAFMHPTHLLKKHFTLGDKFSVTFQAAYPDANASKGLAWRNLRFPFYSLQLWSVLGVFHLFAAWILQSAKPDGKTFMDAVSQLPLRADSLGDFFWCIAVHIRHSPSVVFLNLLLITGLVLFTDVDTGRKKWNYVAGFIHGMIQVVVLYKLIWLFAVTNITHWGVQINSPWQIALFSVEMIAIGGLVSTFIFGIYLLISTLVLKNHPTEAFSSLRWEGYKNFLRIHLTKNDVTIYAVGIKNAISDWERSGPPGKPVFSTKDQIDYTLIDEPIKLKP